MIANDGADYKLRKKSDLGVLHESTESAYRKKTPRSFRLHAKSTRLHINGVHHNIRHFDPYPFVTKSARAQKITDVDSNSYTDYWMGHWSLILGHTPTRIKHAIKSQLERGWMHGTVSEPSIKLSEEIAKTVRVAQKIRYVSSGTEAVMYAARIARTYTKKNIVVKVDGGWHGYASDLLKSVNWPFGSESRGVLNEKNIVSIPHNDLEGSLKILRKVKNNIAGIIIEPFLGGAGGIPSEKNYLHGLQEFAKKYGALFILDEIVTGFRFRFGCMYPTMRLDPDIVTLGKIIGGGMPIGAMCGHDEVMQVADTSSFNKSQRSYVGGGTFSANPVSMTAGLATLQTIKSQKSLYTRIAGLGEDARKGLRRAFDGKVQTSGQGSLFMIHFTQKSHKINSSADAAICDTRLLEKFHFELIAREGIFFLPGKLGAVSAAHTSANITQLIRAAEKFSSTLGGA